MTIATTATFLETLQERGFVKQTSDDDGLRVALARPCTLYCGYDPTADSLTAGHLLSLMLLRYAQAAGHQVICVVGGATGMIGDPTGKSTARPALSPAQIAQNLAAQRAQLSRLLDMAPGRGMVLNNADWIQGYPLLAFLREIGTRFTVSGMLAAETYQTRLGAGLTFTEFTYMLLQAYDFLHLHQQYGCLLQVGGSDQWANSLAGVDLIRRVTGAPAYVLVTPLLTMASGAKMGKTAEGAVWLDAGRTSPYAFYQYWVNTEDADVERFLALFTELPMDEVRRLSALRGADLRVAKGRLAFEVTRLVHGEAAATEAQSAAAALFGGAAAEIGVPTTQISAAQVAAGMTAAELFTQAGLCPSRGAARRLISQGGARLNALRIGEPEMTVTLDQFAGGQALLQAGKKRFARVVLADAQLTV